MKLIDNTLKVIIIILIVAIGVGVYKYSDYIQSRWLNDVTPNTEKLDSLKYTLKYKKHLINEKQDSILQLHKLLDDKRSQDSIVIVKRYKDSMLAIKNRQVEYFLDRTLGVTSSNSRDSIVQVPYPSIVIANQQMLERDMYKDMYDSLRQVFNRSQDLITELKVYNDSLVLAHKETIANYDEILRQYKYVNKELKEKISRRDKIIVGSVVVNLVLILLIL